MGYRIFLIDSLNYVELDTEDIDITTIFSVSDINDISTKKDNITKQITFKGTKVNNNAFGSLFHLNKTSNSSLANKLFFNYNPLRTVDSIVMEDSVVIFKGSMRVLEFRVNKFDEVSYQTVITGKFTDFKTLIQDKLLTDIDMSDLMHQFKSDVIKNSWATSTERYNTTTSAFYSESFANGSGYVYPFIDYGHQFRETYSNYDVTKFHVSNYRPSVYAKEILKRIVEQAGFTYEVKGDSTFLDRFNSLIVPNADEKMTYRLSGFYEQFKKSPSTTINSTGATNSGSLWKYQLMPMSVFIPPPTNTIQSFITHWNTNQQVFYVDRDVTTNGYASLTFQTLTNGSSNEVDVWVTVIEMDFGTDATNPTPPNVTVGETRWNRAMAWKKIVLAAGQTLTNHKVELNIPERKFTETNQIAMRISVSGHTNSGRNNLSYTVSDCELRFPKDTLSLLVADVKINNGTKVDYVTPTLPANIKQADFLKGLMNLFNMYVYTSKKDTKHIIFEQYDDYYAYASHSLIALTALNWTNKIGNISTCPYGISFR